MTPRSTYQRLVETIAPGSTLRRTWQLSGGISASMTAFEFERADGRSSKAIVRRPGAAALERNPRAAEDEFRLLRLLQSAGLPVQAPYYLDRTGAIFGTPCLVVAYIEGRPEFAAADAAAFSVQVAAQLARIHRVDRSRIDLSFLPRRQEQLARDTGARALAVDPSLAEATIRATLAPLWPLKGRNADVLLHGDYWPGNLLWRDGTLAAVLDWEDASTGDPLVDLAISRLDLLTIYGREAMHAFTERYMALMAVDSTDLPYWDLWAALRFARLAGPDLRAWAAFFTPFGRPDITEHTIREHYELFVAQALERLS